MKTLIDLEEFCDKNEINFLLDKNGNAHPISWEDEGLFIPTLFESVLPMETEIETNKETISFLGETFNAGLKSVNFWV